MVRVKNSGMNSIQLQSSYQTSKLPVCNSPREYISVFAVRANAISFCNFTGRTFLLSHIFNPELKHGATDILHLRRSKGAGNPGCKPASTPCHPTFANCNALKIYAKATPANSQFQQLPLKNLSFSFYSKIDFIFFICFAVET